MRLQAPVFEDIEIKNGPAVPEFGPPQEFTPQEHRLSRSILLASNDSDMRIAQKGPVKSESSPPDDVVTNNLKESLIRDPYDGDYRVHIHNEMKNLKSY